MLTDSPVKSPTVSDIPQPNLPKLSPLRPHRTMAVVSSPSPKHVSDSELKVLENCLHRWRTEVESDVRGELSPLRPHRTIAVVSCPSPKHVSDSELKVLENCLHRWRTEVESDVRGELSPLRPHRTMAVVRSASPKTFLIVS